MNVQALWQQCLQAHLSAAAHQAAMTSTAPSPSSHQTLARVVAAAMETSQQRLSHASAASLPPMKSTSPPGRRLASMLLDYGREDGREK